MLGVEDAFAQLAQGKVDVPLPMHIGIAETDAAGPGDCHIKGGYIEGAPTWTVKLANVSFYNNVAKGLPAGSGVFVVCDAANGGPKAVLHENRYLTDMRTGAAGAVAREASGGEGGEERLSSARASSPRPWLVRLPPCTASRRPLPFPRARRRVRLLPAHVCRARLPPLRLRHRGGCRAYRRRHLHPDPAVAGPERRAARTRSSSPPEATSPPKTRFPAILKAKVVTDITAQSTRVGEFKRYRGRFDDRGGRPRRNRSDNQRREGGPGEGAHRVRPDGTGARTRHRELRDERSEASPRAPRRSRTTPPPRLPAPKLYDYDTIKASVAPSKALTEAVEDAEALGRKADAPADAHRHRRDVRRGPATATSRAGTSRALQRGR